MHVCPHYLLQSNVCFKRRGDEEPFISRKRKCQLVVYSNACAVALRHTTNVLAVLHKQDYRQACQYKK